MMYIYMVFFFFFFVVVVVFFPRFSKFKDNFLIVCNWQRIRILYISTENDEFIHLKDIQFEALVRILQQKEIYEKSI